MNPLMLTQIINVLKDAGRLVSGQELSRRLGVTRTAVWKHVEELRDNGYKIAAVPRLGYRLLASPDRLTEVEVRHGLGTKVMGQKIHHFDSLDSTMNEAFRLGMDGAPEGTVVVAETQSKGRGRLGRVWTSPKGKGLYFSIILRPACAPSEAARLTLLAAVAVGEAVETNTGTQARIKWPNDLLLNGKKFCGILTEMNAETDRVRFVIVGIGLNVNAAVSQIPSDATSLKIAQGRAIIRVALLQEILRAFEARYQGMLKDGYAGVLSEWRKRSAMDGRKVRFVDRGRETAGVAVGLAEDGGLLVKLANGAVVKRISGDILL